MILLIIFTCSRPNKLIGQILPVGTVGRELIKMILSFILLECLMYQVFEQQPTRAHLVGLEIKYNSSFLQFQQGSRLDTVRSLKSVNNNFVCVFTSQLHFSLEFIGILKTTNYSQNSPDFLTYCILDNLTTSKCTHACNCS